MNRRYLYASAAFGLGVGFLLATSVRQDQPDQPAGVEVQARGPVHEAFAEPADTQPEQGPVVTKQPPEPIEEIPPDQRPEGDNVQWIPGYWAWDEDASDFIWVSGCWRDVPPGRRWVPGHWQQLDGGWSWVSGFWASETMTEIQYLPPPPPTLDQGPTSPAPDETSIYIPGTWVYQTNRYLWRPGLWIAYNPNWIWVPACYVWTPGGCIFVDGFWDHPFHQRGLLFAPVVINRQAFFAARRPFIPRHVVFSDFLLSSLFVRKATGHYYFGDYFEPRYAKAGFVAWPDYNPVKGAFDPGFAYYRGLNAADKNWEPALRSLYTGRRDGAIPRPPRTLAQQGEAIKTVTAKQAEKLAVSKTVNLTNMQNVTALAPINEVSKTKVTNLAPLGGGKVAKPLPASEVKIEPVPKEALGSAEKSASAIREGAQQRRDWEAKMLGGGKVPVQPTDPPNVTKMNWPKLPDKVGTTRPPQRTAPPAVTAPKNEERPLPKYTPPKAATPPKGGTPPKKGKDDG